MSELNLIKTVLFNAADLNEALTRLTELGISYRACSFIDNGYHIDSSKTECFEITIWPTTSQRCPIAVCMDGHLFDYEDRKRFFAFETRKSVLAGQCETVETPVPAASPEITGQRPAYLLVDFDLNGNVTHKIYPKLSQVRHAIRIERRLKRSQAKGLSS